MVLLLSVLLSLQLGRCQAGWGPNPPVYHLPSIDASKFPPYLPIFRTGECDADDLKGGVINPQKSCYSCFRIPSLTRNPKTGTLYAFAEARRRELHTFHWGHVLDASGGCPDTPDVHIAFKRSTDGGNSWSSLRILAKIPGRFQAQPSPVVDNTTGKLIVLFANAVGRGWNPYAASIIASTDDGVTFSNPIPAVHANGSEAVVLSTNAARGHVVTNGSAVRLLFPSNFGSLYSDDHGATWTIGPPPLGTTGVGEAAIARCTLGDACKGRSWVLISRCVSRTDNTSGHPRMNCPNMAFSFDGVHWDTPVQLDFAKFALAMAAPGAVGVPGALIMSHNGGGGINPLDPKPSQVGEDLLYTEDGKEWKLLQQMWPLSGGYSTLAELETDSSGAATKFGTLFEAGELLGGSNGDIIYMNFTWSKPGKEVESAAPLIV